MSSLHQLSLTEVRDLLQAKKISAQEATQSCLDRISQTEPTLLALLHLAPDQVLAQAKTLDLSGPDPKKSLWGVPIVLTDALNTTDMPTTSASRMLENFTPIFDAHCVQALRQAGAIILGKANLDEFGMGSSTEHSAFQTTKNPWNPDHVPGGASGGAAASVAVGQSFAALATDTGGGLRQPAGFCGLIGLKPTYGRVSRAGAVAHGSSLDQVGPMARSVRDAGALLQVIAGHDPNDPTSLNVPVPDYSAAMSKIEGFRGLRLGLPTQYWDTAMSSEVATACGQAVDLATHLGAEIVPVSLPHNHLALPAYIAISMAEASANLARIDGVRFGRRSPQTEDLTTMYTRSRSEGLGEEVKRRLILGTALLSAEYYAAHFKKAAQVRRLIRQDFTQALTHCDLICLPTSPSTAFPIANFTDTPLAMYQADVFTVALNLSGLPGLTLPVGLGADTGLPVGMQLFGGALEEARLLQAAAVLEAHLPKAPTLPLS